MRHIIARVVVLLLGFTIFWGEGRSVSASAPVLLAQFKPGGPTSQCCSPTFQEITAMNFSLGYGFGQFISIGNARFDFLADIIIGRELLHLPGQSGVFDFNASNTPNFNDLATRLTNGIDENLWTGTALVDDAGLIIAASNESGPESSRLMASPDLFDAQIDFIRLVVNSISITITSADQFGNIGFQAQWDAVWQIYGTPPPRQVDIDIKPGSDPNSINCNASNKVISEAILTTETFDATTVDHTTITFEGASETHVDKQTGEPQRHEEDVDLDGDIDLVFHFRLGDTDLGCDSTEGTIIGETFDRQAIVGVDSVNMIDSGAE